jgi:aryl-alcohol dehydrogenase-like predicted oxidoreductase
VYQIHRPDPDTDIEETLSALTDLVRSGKIRAFGTSTMPASNLAEAHWVAERRGLEREVGACVECLVDDSDRGCRPEPGWRQEWRT